MTNKDLFFIRVIDEIPTSDCDIIAIIESWNLRDCMYDSKTKTVWFGPKYQRNSRSIYECTHWALKSK
jgi:hypothetical protein